MSLYPKFREAFREATQYINLGEGEEKKKNEAIIEKLGYKMDDLSNKMDYAVSPVFGSLDSVLRDSGLKIDSDKIKNIKRRALENMKANV